jgi:hypothetical protein
MTICGLQLLPHGFYPSSLPELPDAGGSGVLAVIHAALLEAGHPCIPLCVYTMHTNPHPCAYTPSYPSQWGVVCPESLLGQMYQARNLGLRGPVLPSSDLCPD